LEKLAFRRSLVKPKVFEALSTQDFFLCPVAEVAGVSGASLDKLTALRRVFDGSSCTTAGLVEDSETGG
jgi:hypothetical protein